MSIMSYCISSKKMGELEPILTKKKKKMVDYQFIMQIDHIVHVTPCPDEVHSTCNCKGTYVH